MSVVHSSVETVNAAATAIVTAESRVQPPTHRKKRWGSCWSLYTCFKSQTHTKKLNHAALVPEPTNPNNNTTESLTTTLLPFTVPPSSPAAFLPSDPPSATQTPATPHSPPGETLIFTAGPYAHETQLVSPPVFSTFTTEPSTAAFTPPVGSVQPTRPSSPDGRAHHPNLILSQHDFQPYQSPVRNLVSNSGTSSPYLNKNFSLKFSIGEVPKLLSLESFSIRNWGSRPDPVEQVSRDMDADVALGNADNDVATNHRLSFDLDLKKEEDESSKKNRSISFGSIKEFDFDNSKGEFPEKSEWWANEKIIGEDLDSSQNNWTFFPLLKSGAV